MTGVGRAGQIGNAVALAFGQAGAKIVACDLNAVGVAERVREFAALGVDARPCAGDLTQPDIAALAVEMALRHFGRLDVVVNVAGGLTTYGPIDKLTVGRLRPRSRDQSQDHGAGVAGGDRGAGPTQGCIVNFASIAYFEPQAPMAVYWRRRRRSPGSPRVSRWSCEDRKIRVNAVAPGMVRTSDNVASAGEDAAYVELQDITDGVLSLASADSATITGHILPIAPAASGKA